MADDVKEFVADTPDEAIAKATGFFGVTQEQLRVHVVPDDPPVSGLGGRTLILASVGEEPEEQAELGPVGAFVAGVLERMGVSGARLSESREESGEIVVTLRGTSVFQLDARDDRALPSLSHLAERAAEKLLDGAVARVELAESGRAAGGRRPSRDRDRDRDRGRGDRNERGDRNDRRDRGDRSERRGRNGRGDRDEVDEEALERLARDAAARVRDTGSPEILRAMSSRERWVVHNALKDEAGIRSESEGEGRTRRVKLVPA